MRRVFVPVRGRRVKGRRSFGSAPPPKAEPRRRPCPSRRGRRAALCWPPPGAWTAFRRRRSPGPAPVCGGEGRKIASSSRVTPCRQSAKRRGLSENTSGRPRLLMIYEGSRKGQTYSVCLSVCLSNYGGKSHAVNPFFADVSRASRFCASVQTPRKSGLARRCPRPFHLTLRRLATPRSPDNSAPRQRVIVRYNKSTIAPSAIQGFCVNPLYLFRERVEKTGFFRREQNISLKIWPKRPVRIVVWVEGENGAYLPGRGGGAASQHGYCTNISWSDALPGDLVFYADDSHVGIVCGYDSVGNILVIHCSGGQNGVVVTGREGFAVAARPDLFTD